MHVILLLTINTAGGGGIFLPPPLLFCNNSETRGDRDAKFRIASNEVQGQIRSQWHH